MLAVGSATVSQGPGTSPATCPERGVVCRTHTRPVGDLVQRDDVGTVCPDTSVPISSMIRASSALVYARTS
jgi:hypothetical protein